MGRYLDIIKQAGLNERNEIDERSHTSSCAADIPRNQADTFVRINRFFRTISALEARCPDHVPADRWQQAVEDGRAFLATWGEQAQALGWTSADLFGLHPVPANPHPSYSRLSRYDATGLIWLLQCREVIALTDTTASVRNPTGSITTYRRFNKPALGPLGDSLDDLK